MRGYKLGVEPMSAKAQRWLTEHPEGCTSLEFASLQRITPRQASKVMTTLHGAGKIGSRREPKGQAANTLRFYALQHLPPQAPVTLKTSRKPKHRAVVLDKTKVATNTVKVTRCPGFTGQSPFAVTEAPPIFSCLGIGRYYDN